MFPKIFLYLLSAGYFLLAMPTISNAQMTMGVAAVVNDEAISIRDVEERIKLVLVSSGLPDGKDIRAKILPQVLDGLIDEKIKLQEAARFNIVTSDEEVQAGLDTIAKQNNLTGEQFIDVMRKQGVPKATLIHQIKAQLAWNNVVKTKLRRLVDVSETDTNTQINRLKGKVGQTEYLVSEIFLPTDDAKRKGEISQFADRMAKELQAKKAPFGPVAAQFSKAAGAQNGGSLGWISAGDLPPKLDNVLGQMTEGQISDPIITTEGIYLLFLQKKRVFTEDSIPSREEITNNIGFERLDRVQQRALMDLKSAAFIDRRL